MRLLRMIEKAKGQNAQRDPFDQRLKTLETNAGARRVQVSLFRSFKSQPVRRAA